MFVIYQICKLKYKLFLIHFTQKESYTIPSVFSKVSHILEDLEVGPELLDNFLLEDAEITFAFELVCVSSPQMYPKGRSCNTVMSVTKFTKQT